MSEIKKANLDHPVHEIIARRWSPYSYADKMVGADDLRSIFEAARWAASAFNEQPWRYLVALKENPEAFEKLLSCLVESNQAWAKNASVLALGIVSRNFSRNGKPNRTALHDLGLASAQLTMEASARGIMVHQMAGILPDRARDLYKIPEGFDAVTGLALGYFHSREGEMAERDATPRQRTPQSEFVFGDNFDQSWREK